jgi:hypothetical protein
MPVAFTALSDPYMSQGKCGTGFQNCKVLYIMKILVKFSVLLFQPTSVSKNSQTLVLRPSVFITRISVHVNIYYL